MSEEIQFHSERAMTELDRAHFGLSSLHLQRIKAIRETPVSEETA